MADRPLCVGDTVQDDDPRSGHRLPMVVEKIIDRFAVLRGHHSHTTVRLDRIHVDGKRRRSGWSRVPTE